MRLAFRFRPIPFIATVLLVVLGILLGNWQTRRAEEKLAIAAQVAQRSADPPLLLGGADNEGARAHDRVGTSALRGPAHPTEPGQSAAELEYRRVRVKGEWVAGWPLYLDNRPHAGVAGFYLAMPFKIAGSDAHVLVLRGWLPRDPREYGRLPAIATPPGRVTIEGTVVGSAGHVMYLGVPGVVKPGAIVQNVDSAEVARASGLALAPWYVQQSGPALPGEGLVRDWPEPTTGVDKHRGYAFQWYALAAMAALFFVITGFRSGRKDNA